MLQLVIDRPPGMGGTPPDTVDDFGGWTGYHIPQDRADWHPLVRRLYDYWQSIAPPGRLPGRPDLVPEDIAQLWSRLWMLDVHRNPLRYRYRLCGTEIVRSLGREVTGEWLDQVHPALIANPQSRERFHFTAETGCPTWRRGLPLWIREPKHLVIETLIVPLAGDGHTVDIMLGVSVMFDFAGKPV
ncbi:MAG TPA: PAS domain-containing protein [Stellaceae bacterium]|nr:PAS domain-containing protein [Stellaceae bacterium]